MPCRADCRFECKSDGGYLQIMHISLEKADEDPQESEYTGPVRHTLAIGMQQHLHSQVP